MGQLLLIHEIYRPHKTTHHRRQDSSSQRPLPYNTYNTHNRQTSMPSVGFEPTNSANLRLRSHGHWDRHIVTLHSAIIFHLRELWYFQKSVTRHNCRSPTWNSLYRTGFFLSVSLKRVIDTFYLCLQFLILVAVQLRYRMAFKRLKKTRTDWVYIGCWGWGSVGADENICA